MDAATDRSLSPPAPPPVAQSPGRLATQLQYIFGRALEATIKKCSYSNFATCFPTPAKYASDSLRSVWQQLTEALDNQCRSQFDLILADRSVIPTLNMLDQLLADAQKRRDTFIAQNPPSTTTEGVNSDQVPTVRPPTPPHSLTPAQLHQAHLQPFLASHSSLLTARLSAVQTSNSELVEQIKLQRAEMEALVRGLESVVNDLEKAVVGLDIEEPVQQAEAGLSGEVRDVDAELLGARGG